MTFRVLGESDSLKDHISKLTSILLDFDGTLVDYYRNEAAALGKVLSYHNVKRNLHPTVIKRYREINEALWKQFELDEVTLDDIRITRFAKLIEQFEINGDPSEMNEYYIENFGKEVDTFPGIVEYLHKFSIDHPELDLIVVTNGADEIQKTRAQNTGLDQVLDGIVSSDAAGHSKPSPNIFHYTADKYQIDLSTTFMVGDSLSSDILGAHNMGIPSCLIFPNDHPSKSYEPSPNIVSKNCITFLQYVNKIRTKK